MNSGLKVVLLRAFLQSRIDSITASFSAIIAQKIQNYHIQSIEYDHSLFRSEQFKRAFQSLPKDIQKKGVRALRLMAEDIFHPS
jgi:hypothetical protein